MSRYGLVLDPPLHTGVVSGPAPFKSEAELMQWVALFPAGTTFRWWYSRAPTSDLFEPEWWGDDAARCWRGRRGQSQVLSSLFGTGALFLGSGTQEACACGLLGG